MEEKITNQASIEVITDIQPIENADRIECLSLLGYKTVAQRGLYHVNDKAIFVRPDSLVPRRVWSAFLFPKDDQSFDGPPIRIICRRFKKQISMGLVLPLATLGDCLIDNLVSVDTILGITKYEKILAPELAGVAKGNFPSFLKKTDELNLLSYPDAINEFKDKEVYITTKYDGSSMTVYYNEGVFGVCSRNLDLKETDGNAFWKVARQLDLENKLSNCGFNIALQLELIGPGIQGNKCGVDKIMAVCFNAFNINSRTYFDFDPFVKFCDKYLIPKVNIIYEGKFKFTIDQLKEITNKGEYSNGNPIEGIVIRTKLESYSEVLEGRMSCKVISEKFALKYGE